jgi:hypothetical protein
MLSFSITSRIQTCEVACMARRKQVSVHVQPPVSGERKGSKSKGRRSAKPASAGQRGLQAQPPGPLGPGSVLPNLYWCAIPHQQLRHYHPHFVGLPFGEDVSLDAAQPTTYSWVWIL